MKSSDESVRQISASRTWLDKFGDSARGLVSWSFACSFAEAYAASETAILQQKVDEQRTRGDGYAEMWEMAVGRAESAEKEVAALREQLAALEQKLIDDFFNRRK
jgi:hypothetical protein